MATDLVTLIIPCLNEEAYIASVLDSLITQSYPQEKTEILVVDGGSHDNTANIIRAYEQRHSNIKYLHNPGRTAPKALNLGIAAARGGIIMRVDAHCEYPNYYTETLVYALEELKADNVGASIITLPGSNTTWALAIALVMGHPFGVGNSGFRIGTSKTIRADTVPFGCYRREVFEKIGGFDEDLTRNQDDEFNARLINAGGKIFLIGSLTLKYFARPKLHKAVEMFYQYGLFKPLVNKKLGKPATLRQFAPPIFALAWPLLVLMVPFFSFLPVLLLAAVYFIPAIYFGLRAAIKQKQAALIIEMPITFFSIHMAYGYGYLKGIVKFYLLGQANTEARINR